MTPQEVSRNLRVVQEKHKNDFTPTFNVCLSDMARDSANAIDTLLAATEKTITICGSTRFKEEFLKAQCDLTFDGWIVFSVPFFEHADNMVLTREQKEIAIQSHLRKIAVSSAIYVINKGGYIGESTKNEIQYAKDHGKQVIFMENLKDLRKDGYDSLASAIYALNQIKRDLNSKYGSEEFFKTHEISSELYQLAYHDSLTGCYNRNMLEKMRTELDNKAGLVIVIDLDNFKQYNTDYGHIGGDRRLKEVAEKLQGSFRRAFRLGGDEFMLITDRRFNNIDEVLNAIGGLSYGIYEKRSSEFLSSAMHKADFLMYENKKRKQKTEAR